MLPPVGNFWKPTVAGYLDRRSSQQSLTEEQPPRSLSIPALSILCLTTSDMVAVLISVLQTGN